jgi:hypothetical protein
VAFEIESVTELGSDFVANTWPEDSGSEESSASDDPPKSGVGAVLVIIFVNAFPGFFFAHNAVSLIDSDHAVFGGFTANLPN